MLETEYDASNINMDKDTDKNKDRLKTMYRSLARIRLRKSEEGYGLFQGFMENDTFRRLEATKRGEILVALFRLYEQIIKIKALCRYRSIPDNENDDSKSPVHYTKIDTLKKILPDDKKNSGKLRLWNTVYMNDSFEGSCFIDMMAQVGKKIFKYNNEGSDNKKTIDEKMKIYFPFLDKQSSKNDDTLIPINENIYVTSFSEQRNEIHMWVPYADDAKGCAITFADDFFDIRRTEDLLTDASSYSDDDYPLYKIQYLDESEWEKWIAQDTTELKDFFKDNQIGNILESMKEIWNILYELDDRINDNIMNTSTSDETKFIQNFVSKCLNEVRFLIKSSEYSFEKEVRMLHYSNDPKIDAENFTVPRLYVEVNRDIQIKEVKLGSKVNDSQANEIVSWLTKTGKVQKITKSKRHYK